MDHSVKLILDQRETRIVQFRRGVSEVRYFLPVLFNLYSKYLTKGAAEESGDFQIGGQVIRAVKYAD